MLSTHHGLTLLSNYSMSLRGISDVVALSHKSKSIYHLNLIQIRDSIAFEIQRLIKRLNDEDQVRQLWLFSLRAWLLTMKEGKYRVYWSH